MNIPLYTSVRADSDEKYVRSSGGNSCSIRLRATNVNRSSAIPEAAARRGNEQLTKRRHRGAGGLAETVRLDRHVAPPEHREATARRRSSRPGPGLCRAIPRRPAGRRSRPRIAPAGGSSKSTTSRNNRSGIWIRIPAPSPVSASAPVAPRCSRLHSADRPVRTSSLDADAAHVGDEGHAARIVLETRVIETRSNWVRLHRCFHLGDRIVETGTTLARSCTHVTGSKRGKKMHSANRSCSTGIHVPSPVCARSRLAMAGDGRGGRHRGRRLRG